MYLYFVNTFQTYYISHDQDYYVIIIAINNFFKLFLIETKIITIISLKEEKNYYKYN